MHSALIFSILQDLCPLGAVRSAYWISFNNKKKEFKIFPNTVAWPWYWEEQKSPCMLWISRCIPKGVCFVLAFKWVAVSNNSRGLSLYSVCLSTKYQNQFSRKAISSDYWYYGVVSRTSSEPTKICQNWKCLWQNRIF